MYIKKEGKKCTSYVRENQIRFFMIEVETKTEDNYSKCPVTLGCIYTFVRKEEERKPIGLKRDYRIPTVFPAYHTSLIKIFW